MSYNFKVTYKITLTYEGDKPTEEEQMELTITLKDGATNKDIASQLRWQANLIEGMDPKEAAKLTATAAPAKMTAKKAAAAPAADEDDDFKADTGGDASGFDDDDTDTVAETSFDDAAPEEEEEKPAPKKAAAKGSNGKAKKITLDDVNDACKAHAAAKGRPATLAVLQKKFKTQSVTALKPEQYEMAIAAMAVN